MARGSKRRLPLSVGLAPTAQKRRRGRPYPPDPQIWFDGIFIKEKDLPRSFPSWRMATAGGVCTELHAVHTKPRFFSHYFNWLLESAAIAMLPPLANVTEESVYEACVGVLNKNMYFENALLRLSIFPTYATGSFGRAEITSSLLLEAKQLSSMGFSPRAQGLLIRVLEDETKALNERAKVQWIAPPSQWISQRLLNENLWSDYLLLNRAGRVAHAIGGMVYCRIDDGIVTPPLSEGVRYDPIRTYAEEACFSATGKSVAQRPLTIKELESADEVFLVSSVSGVEWVLGINNSRYAARISNTICDKLNRIYFPELFL